jgi:DNA helicase-2/ATP-dependent DNA helicase PcrA
LNTFLDKLNPTQLEAVKHIDGPLMVIAGAGSGKTRVLTYRIAHLLKNGVDSFNILALTFTNKASKEMKARIGGLIGGNEANNLWMGTFHSVFSKILRFEADKINYPKNFTIYDSADAKNLIKTLVKELNLDKDVYKPGVVLGRISSLKNGLVSVNGYKSSAVLQSEDSSRKMTEFSQLYANYQKRLFSSGSMDFDDLLFNTYTLLRDFPDVLNKYQNKFKYILVDEYQDTNHVQYMIIKRLAAMFENICVVGDDAQSIYAFRGANIQNIFNFEKDYPDFKSVKLEQNYRSTQTIVNAANSLIKHNKNQIKKTVFSKNSYGELIKVCKTISDSEEGNVVSQSIFETQMNKRCSFNDFAVLYRTNAQSRSLEESLRKRNIPYKIFGGLSFYQRKEVKDLLSYFRLMINPQDEEALKRVINYPTRGIGNTTIQKLLICARTNNISIWECIENPLFHSNININSGTLSKLTNFVLAINSFKVQLNDDAYQLAEFVAKSTGLLGELNKDKTPEGISRLENIQELLNAIKEFSVKNQERDLPHDLGTFMEDVALLTDQDNDKDDEKNRVTLMTIHAAKGLEFPFVYLVGLEENLFPSQLAMHSRQELEEERRLFYVGLTRAEKRIHLSYATSRWRWGQLIDCEPSRFLEEIDDSLLDWQFVFRNKQKVKPKANNYRVNTNYTAKQKPTAKTAAPKFIPKNLTKVNQKTTSNGPFNDNSELLKVDMLVEHERFGIGKIVSIENKNGSKKAIVLFNDAGEKQLLLKFAKLKIIK